LPLRHGLMSLYSYHIIGAILNGIVDSYGHYAVRSSWFGFCYPTDVLSRRQARWAAWSSSGTLSALSFHCVSHNAEMVQERAADRTHMSMQLPAKCSRSLETNGLFACWLSSRVSCYPFLSFSTTREIPFEQSHHTARHILATRWSCILENIITMNCQGCP
jgi:hypothetical protein